MKARRLNKSHYKIWEKNPEISQSKEHTKLSIQFAIEVLEESITDTSYHEVDSFCKSKIQELKQYYDSQI